MTKETEKQVVAAVTGFVSRETNTHSTVGEGNVLIVF